MSVMEMSHRGKEFVGIAAEAEADLRKLLDIPDNYKVIFMQASPPTPQTALSHVVKSSCKKHKASFPLLYVLLGLPVPTPQST